MASRQNQLSSTLKSLWPAALIVLLVLLTFVLLYEMDFILSGYEKYSYQQYLTDSVACADNFTSSVLRLHRDSDLVIQGNLTAEICKVWREQLECRRQVSLKLDLVFNADTVFGETCCG